MAKKSDYIHEKLRKIEYLLADIRSKSNVGADVQETGEKLLREIKDYMEATASPGKPLDPTVCKTLLERAIRDFQEALNGEDD